jgi:hypothetical protein
MDLRAAAIHIQKSAVRVFALALRKSNALHGAPDDFRRRQSPARQRRLLPVIEGFDAADALVQQARLRLLKLCGCEGPGVSEFLQLLEFNGYAHG